MKLHTSIATILVCVASTSICFAGTMDHFIAKSGSDVITFSLPSSPTPDQTDEGGGGPQSEFTFNSVAVTINGVTAFDTVSFFGGGSDGGFCISTGDVVCDGGDLVSQAGATVFTGLTSAPTFLLGTTAQVDFGPSGANTFAEPFTLEISAVPEPSSLALLLTGSLGFLKVARRKLPL